MNCFKTELQRICIALLFLSFYMCPVQAQTPLVNASEIIRLFKDYAKRGICYEFELVQQIVAGGQSNNIFRELDTKANNHQFRSRLYALKGGVLILKDVNPGKKSSEEYRATPAV